MTRLISLTCSMAAVFVGAGVLAALGELGTMSGCEGYEKKPGLLEAVGILPEPTRPLSVMTFNVRYGTADDHEDAWPKRRELFFQTIAGHAPDVLCYQEALRMQLDDTHAALPQYTEVGVGRDDGKTKGEYSAILFLTDRFTLADSGNFWLSDTPGIPGSKTWGNIHNTRICTWARLTEKAEGGRSFYVFNTHLDNESENARRHSVELIAQRIVARKHPEDPVIFTGDFNSDETSASVQFIEGKIPSAVNAPKGRQPATPPETDTPPVVAGWKGMPDSFRIAHPDAKQVWTYHGFKGLAAKARDNEGKIDYIFVPAGTEVMEAGIDFTSRDGHYPSDHFPVYAVIKLKW